MKTPHKQKKTDAPRVPRGMFPILVVIALILMISLFLVDQQPANSQGLTVTPSPYATVTPSPYATFKPTPVPSRTRTPLPPAPTLAPTRKPPACQFPLAQTTTTETASESYAFSPPKAVTLNSSWNQVYLYQWLPDNQRVLIAHSDEVQMGDRQQTIGLLNPQTGASQDFGSRSRDHSRSPVWIPSLQAVVYPESLWLRTTRFSNNDQSSGLPPSDDFQRRLWISRGDPIHLQTLVDEEVTVNLDRPSWFGERFTVAASPDGSEIVYLDDVGRQLYVQKVAQGTFQSVPSPAFDATQWIYRPPPFYATPGVHPPPGVLSLQEWWSMTWRPNSMQVFLYSQYTYPNGFSYTFLLDVQTGQVCELNLWEDDPIEWQQSWALQADWSPNGRYLSVVRTKGAGMADFSDLIVLDTTTGKLYQIEPPQISPVGMEEDRKHYISDVAWAPDNRHIAAIGEVGYWTATSDQMQFADRLFLLDFLTGQSFQISSAELGSWEWPNWGRNGGLLWSNDGSQLIELGPGGLYLLSVQK